MTAPHIIPIAAISGSISIASLCWLLAWSLLATSVSSSSSSSSEVVPTNALVVLDCSSVAVLPRRSCCNDCLSGGLIVWLVEIYERSSTLLKSKFEVAVEQVTKV
jgi:hypothetical protein